MRGTLSFALVLGLVSSPAVVLVGCSEESKTQRTEMISTPGGTTTTTSEVKVESTGENPPPNFAGETGETGN